MHFCGFHTMRWNARSIYQNAWLCREASNKHIMPFALRGVFVSIFKHFIRNSFIRFFSLEFLLWHLGVVSVVVVLKYISVMASGFSHARNAPNWTLNIEYWTSTICYYITLLLMFCVLPTHFQCTIIPLLLNPNNRERGARASKEVRHRCRCLLGRLWTDERLFHFFSFFSYVYSLSTTYLIKFSCLWIR